jgi:hypothetical protein
MLFVATNTAEMEHTIRNMNPRQLMEQVNNRAASQARKKYVWGSDDTQLRFVRNRFGRMEPSTPLETRFPA